MTFKSASEEAIKEVTDRDLGSIFDAIEPEKD